MFINYRLLNTIPALNQSRIFFTSTGAIFFGIEYQQERDERFPQVSNFYHLMINFLILRYSDQIFAHMTHQIIK